MPEARDLLLRGRIHDRDGVGLGGVTVRAYVRESIVAERPIGPEALTDAAPEALPVRAADATVAAKIATLPNLQTLFGSLDYCQCRECRPVYSASAHFVDVLRFARESIMETIYEWTFEKQ
jgi:hypothetical protein